MHSFHYKQVDGRNTLHCEDVDLQALAEEHGTPLYVYSKATILDHYRRLDAALGGRPEGGKSGSSDALVDHLICFAVKANSNLAILNLLDHEGAGFDIVSGGELYRVLRARAEREKEGPASDCTFAGVGKSYEEIKLALNEGIYCFNAESEAEVAYIDSVAGALGKKAPVALRVNPNVDAKTHKYISTGKSENKFGIDFEVVRDAYARAAKLEHITLRGIQMHIGSQLTSVEPFVEAVKKVAPLAEELKSAYGIEFFSIGGGIGIVYQDSLASGEAGWWKQRDSGENTPLTIEKYAQTLVPLLKPLGLRILLEPGRMIVGNAGALVTKVLYEKKGAAKTFEIVDAGMNDLIRPALYEGHHDIVPVTPAPDSQGDGSGSSVPVDIVGPVCESGDFLAQDRVLPPMEQGDYLAVLSAGAYGFVMASNYNSRPLPPEILVDGGKSRVIRERQTYHDLVRGETIPR